MTTVGFIDSGRIAGTVAGLSVAAGHRVVLSDALRPGDTDGPGRRTRAAGISRDRRAGRQAGDIVLVKIALSAYQSLPAEPSARTPATG
jgi:hypothetical protein